MALQITLKLDIPMPVKVLTAVCGALARVAVAPRAANADGTPFQLTAAAKAK